jgi:hypothetical protein
MLFHFQTTGRRVEVDWRAGLYIMVRFPLIGDVLWDDEDGIRRWPWSEVKQELQRNEIQCAEAQEPVRA